MSSNAPQVPQFNTLWGSICADLGHAEAPTSISEAQPVTPNTNVPTPPSVNAFTPPRTPPPHRDEEDSSEDDDNFEESTIGSVRGGSSVFAESRPFSCSASAVRKRREKEYEYAARMNIDESDTLFKSFPDIKIGTKKVHAKRHFNKGPAKFALLVLANDVKFAAFKDKALNVLSRACESVLRSIDDSGKFTKEDSEGVILALGLVEISAEYRDEVRGRIDEWKKKQRQAAKAYARPARSFDINTAFDAIMNLSDKKEDVATVYKNTAPARFAWLKDTNITVVDALRKFHHYKCHSNMLAEIDFVYLTSSKPPEISNLGNFFRDQQQALVALAYKDKLITIDERATVLWANENTLKPAKMIKM